MGKPSVSDVLAYAEQRDRAANGQLQPGHTLGGRHTILTDALIDQITALVREGHYIETVCQSIGIGKKTYYNWLERGLDELDANPDADTPHSRFVHSVKTAEADAEISLGRQWLAADAKEWLKYATFSSRRFRKHWHDKEPEQHNTFVQNNYGLMPGQEGYEPPRLPAAIEAEVLSPPHREAESERARIA